jgi:prolyl oligopeptidase
MCVFLASLALTCAVLPALSSAPPPTRVEPVTDTLHGERVVDPFRWLEALEKDSEEVAAWTTAQNNHTRSILDNLPCRSSLEAQLASLMTVGSISAPVSRGNRYFYTERKGDQNQPVLLMRTGFDGAPSVLLDVNSLDDKGLYSLDWHVPSEDGSMVAFGLSYAGSEMTVLHVMRVDSGEWLADSIPGKTGFAGWLPDGSGFFYSALSEPSNAYTRAILFHELGLSARHDPVLITQKEPSRVPFAGLSRNGRWLITGLSEGWARNDLSVVDVAEWRRTGEFRQVPIAEGLNGRFNPSVVVGDTAYIVTTLDAPNGRVFTVNLTDPARERWTPLIAERADAVLQELEHARGFLVAIYEKDASTRIERLAMDGGVIGPLPLPGIGSAGLTTNEDRTEAFLVFTSFNEPTTVYRVDVASGDRTLWARPDVPVDPSTIAVEQVFATSKDGTKVPMFIVHRKGLERNGKNPTLIYGYGGFNVSLTPNFRPERFVWLDRGGVYVVANLRGGAEYGERWHQEGMLAKKQNVFDDLYACAEWLIQNRWTTPERLAVLGGSNGGLLTGVAATQRPDLWAAAVSAVPLLDMLRYHQFLMARFWVPEYGAADDQEQFGWLRAYSPYHNVKQGARHPAMLFTAGENDSRVHPLHARKMTALMQQQSANDPASDPILLWVDREAGHGAGKPLALRIRDQADIWGFIMWQTGLCE